MEFCSQLTGSLELGSNRDVCTMKRLPIKNSVRAVLELLSAEQKPLLLRWRGESFQETASSRTSETIPSE